MLRGFGLSLASFVVLIRPSYHLHNYRKHPLSLTLKTPKDPLFNKMMSLKIATLLAIAALATTSNAAWCGCKNNFLQSRTNTNAEKACGDAGLSWHSGTFGGCDVGDRDTENGKANLETYKQKCVAISSEYTVISCK
ncbi:hypothetical protein MVEG_10369 [Podila verticillata NRRL 6337]|nr:hypothetical protein MVEG_10369 [Podila verticillata NRRL 6337]